MYLFGGHKSTVMRLFECVLAFCVTKQHQVHDFLETVDVKLAFKIRSPK